MGTDRTSPDEALTRTDRQDLLKVIRSRERVARAQVLDRTGELRAEFERQMATIHKFDDDQVWAEATRQADAATQQAAAIVADRCAELGIPREFAPSLTCNWYGRGQNASRERRAELRAVATSRIEAIQRSALASIAQASTEAQEAIVAGGLSSTAARAKLAALPPVASLMPYLEMESIVAGMQKKRIK